MMRWILGVAFLIFLGCSSVQVSTPYLLPAQSRTAKIVVAALNNYTDTPQAGMRAANIVEGILHAKGFNVASALLDAPADAALHDKLDVARKQGIAYVVTGGISEWRYKTGIDGEPAVSLQLKMIDVKSQRTVWSATGSDNDWGNASIGTTAQSLIDTMITLEFDHQQIAKHKTDALH